MSVHSKCFQCGTEYPHGVTSTDDGSCDWCPGVMPEPLPSTVTMKNGSHVELVEDFSGPYRGVDTRRGH